MAEISINATTTSAPIPTAVVLVALATKPSMYSLSMSPAVGTKLW